MDSIVFISGATAGIGKACAEIFAQNHYKLIITGRRNERLQQLKADLEKKYNTSVLTICFDIRNRNEVKKQIEQLSAKWKNISILINNAGLASGLAPIQEGDIDDWETMIDTNIKGLLYLSRAIMPEMIKNKNGHIINVASIAGKEAYPNGNVYCATKHAVDAISKAMRIDLLPHGIKVTNIAPGLVETEFSLVRFKGDAERAKQTYNRLKALEAKDIADVIYFAATRPANVTLNDIVITPLAQAMTRDVIHRE
ncbi:MAG: SDR family NAD(P)-dependent oxidoreductase [Bacteroidia bacterium]|nr:SDR family NAD(P)-dependent oxidoreductase [Bacteroidia bacterium]